MFPHLQEKFRVWREARRQNMKACTRIIWEHRVRPRKLYRVPWLRASLQETEEGSESWRELFFDLIYVAMAFKLGEGITEAIENKNVFLDIIPYFTAQFLPMYSLWFARTSYMSKYKVDSFFHSAIDAMYALLVAFMALFIGSRNKILEVFGNDDIEEPINSVVVGEEDESVFLDYNLLLAFSASYLFCQTIELLRYLEMGIVASYNVGEYLNEIQAKAIISTSKVDVTRQAIGIMLTFLAIVGVWVENITLTLVALMLPFGNLILFHMLRHLKTTIKGKEISRIPMNLSFMIGRMGEFTMLMIGEGMLQIIISVVDSNMIGTFAISFAVLSQLHFMAFYIVPEDAKDHAFKKSAWASLLLHLFFPISAGALIFVGVALELILKTEGRLEDEENSSIRWLLAFGLIVTSFSFVMQDLLHIGWHKIIRKDFSEHGKKDNSWSNFHIRRVVFSLIYAISPFLFLILGFYRKSASDLLGISIGIQMLVTILGRTGRRYFEKAYGSEKGNIGREGRMNEQETELIRRLIQWRSGENFIEVSDDSMKLPDVDEISKLDNLLRFLASRSLDLRRGFSQGNGTESQLLEQVSELKSTVSLIEAQMKISLLSGNSEAKSEASELEMCEHEIEEAEETNLSRQGDESSGSLVTL